MIQFAVGKLGLSLQEVLDMTWSEFVIKSIAYRDKLEREETLFREVAYQSYCNRFTFSAKSPPPKDRFWPIGRRTPVKLIGDKVKNVFLEAYRNYKKKRDANIRS